MSDNTKPQDALHQIIIEAEGDAEGDRDTWLRLVAERCYAAGRASVEGKRFSEEEVRAMLQRMLDEQFILHQVPVIRVDEFRAFASAIGIKL